MVVVGAFYLPLMLSVIGSGCFLFLTEMHWFWKGLALAVTASSIFMQFGMTDVHFMIPLLMQVFAD